MSYRELVAADRRLCILRLLMESAGSANEAVIEKALEALGHRAEMERALVRTYLRDLEAADLVTITLYSDKVMVAQITARGCKVAKGQITVEGVATPSFGA